MTGARLRRINESGTFEWPWTASSGLAILTGAAGGGGGGGGALCWEALNLFGGGGGGGGGGGHATTLKIGEQVHRAAGGDGGDGGGGGGLDNGRPVSGKNGRGCNHGAGGDGGRGALAAPDERRIVANGGDGGKGFPGETAIAELHGLSKGDRFEIEVGSGGTGGRGGEGYENGGAGAVGSGGFVLVVPLHADPGAGLC